MLLKGRGDLRDQETGTVAVQRLGSGEQQVLPLGKGGRCGEKVCEGVRIRR